MKIIHSVTATIKRLLASIRSTYSLAPAAPALGPASTPNINALLLHLCDGDHGRALWVLRWMAYPLREKGAKMATALLVRGGQGSGKSLFFEKLIKPMYGNQAYSADRHSSHFNSWMSAQRFVVVDGLDWMNQNPAQLKGLLTSSNVIIERKGSPAAVEANRMNFVFMSGAFEALPIDNGDRRFMVIEQPARLPPAVYWAVAEEINNGGIEAFHDFLIAQLAMDDFGPRTLPAKPNVRALEAA